MLTTDRLLLRPYTLNDLDQAFAVLEGHSDVWRYDPGHARTHEERAEELRFRIAELKRKGVGCFAVVLRAEERFIGYCGLQLYLWERQPFSSPEVELFYKLGRDHWSKGYATEAARAVVDHAFNTLRLPRLVSWALAENERSVALLRRLGFEVQPAAEAPGEVVGILTNPALMLANEVS
jgi:RimJ/RimL family protein N-acetyltransferase